MNPENIESSCGYLLISVAVTERGVASKVNTFSFDDVNFFFFRSSKRMYLAN
jgi:hypothetical protein